MLKQGRSQAVSGLGVAGLHLGLGAKLFFGLGPLGRSGVDQAELQMQLRSVGAESQGFEEFFFSLRHLSQHKIIFRECLVSTRRIRVSGDQRVDRLLGQKPAGSTEIVKQIGIVRMLRQSSLQVLHGWLEVAGSDLCDPQRGWLLNLGQVSNRFGVEALRQKRVSEQLVRGGEVR